MSDDEMVQKINQAASTAETFSHLYYKKLDQERHTIDQKYHENAIKAWNGKPVDGVTNIQQILLEKFQKSKPVHAAAAAGQTTVLVNVVATVYGTSQPVNFQQNFFLTAQNQSEQS